MDLGGADFLTAGGATGFVVLLGKYIWDQVRGRKDKLEERTEDDAREAMREQQEKLEEVLGTVRKMDRDLSILGDRLSTQAGAVTKIEERVNGIGEHYGPRIGQLEQRVAVLEANASGARSRRK